MTQRQSYLSSMPVQFRGTVPQLPSTFCSLCSLPFSHDLIGALHYRSPTTDICIKYYTHSCQSLPPNPLQRLSSSRTSPTSSHPPHPHPTPQQTSWLLTGSAPSSSESSRNVGSPKRVEWVSRALAAAKRATRRSPGWSAAARVAGYSGSRTGRAEKSCSLVRPYREQGRRLKMRRPAT